MHLSRVLCVFPRRCGSQQVCEIVTSRLLTHYRSSANGIATVPDGRPNKYLCQRLLTFYPSQSKDNVMLESVAHQILYRVDLGR